MASLQKRQNPINQSQPAGKDASVQPSSKWRDWFERGFPPPEFLRFNFAGINISDHSVKICKTSLDGYNYQVDYLDTVSLPEGSIEAGSVTNSEAVIKVLKKIRDTYRIEFVRVSIPEELIYVFSLDLPPTPEKTVRSVAEFHLADHLPLTVDEVNFDYEIVGIDARGRITNLVITAVPKHVTEELTTIINEAGMVPLSFEVEAQAIARSIVADNDPKSYLMLDIGRSRTGISIVSNGIVRYTTTESFGGDQIVAKIAELKEISLVEAEKIKQKRGFNWKDYSTKEAGEIKLVLDNIITEIKRRSEFWLSQSGQPIDEILVVGGNASTPNLPKYFFEQTDIPVSVPQVWKKTLGEVPHQKLPVDPNHSLSYAAVVGLAINENR